MRVGRHLVAAAVVVILSASVTQGAMAAAPAKAPWKLPVRKAKVQRLKKLDRVAVTLDFRDIITPKIAKKLQSGLPTTIVMAGGVFDATTKRPITGAALWQSCKIAFDVWNEVYRIRVTSSAGNKQFVALALPGVIRRCAAIKTLPVSAPLAKGRHVFVAVTVEVNPVSEKMLQSIHRWVRRPPGSSFSGPTDSLFGSFVGLFVARIGRVDERISFRTEIIQLP